MEELIKQAKEGDAEAQFLLGLAYHNGDGLEISPEKAFRWWMKAAKQEYVFANTLFNLLLRTGIWY
jgi:TPR repeat protein